jgi:hypothetical protein
VVASTPGPLIWGISTAAHFLRGIPGGKGVAIFDDFLYNTGYWIFGTLQNGHLIRRGENLTG